MKALAGAAPFQTITITLETPAEVQALYDLVNYGEAAVRRVVEVNPTVPFAPTRALLYSIYTALNAQYGSIGHGKERIA